MLAFSIGKRKEWIPLTTFEAFIDFHTAFSFRHTINFYYNLQYDFEGMLKLSSQEHATLLNGDSSIWLNDKCGLTNEENHTYRLSYIPKKAFHIKVKGQKKYSYYDNLQYFQQSLNNAAKAYLGVEKHDFSAEFTSKPLFDLKSTPAQEIKRFRKHIQDNEYLDDEEKKDKIKKMVAFFSKFADAQSYRDKVISYCIQDADIGRKLGEIVVAGVNEFVNTKNFNSTATISEYYFRSNGIELPKFAPSIFKKFLRSYYGGRFEITRKGYIENIWMYDIKSAYPYAMSTMPILTTNTVAKNSFKMHDDALYGSYCIDVNIPRDLYISPLPKRDSIVTFPTGKFTDYWVDKITLNLLQDLGFNYKIKKACELFDENADMKLTPLILKLFNIKEDKKNPEVVRMAAKIILNSLYGKFIQLVDDNVLQVVESIEELDHISPSALFNIMGKYFKKVHSGEFKTGKLFAPQYASYITAHTRDLLYRTVMKINPDKLVGFHTDSIMLQNATIPTGPNLGDYEIEVLKEKNDKGEVIRKVAVENANLYLLKSGFYECKKDGLSKIRSRGIGRTDTLLKKEFLVKRRYGLKQAIRKDFEEMNVISENIIANNIDSDVKRIWERQLTLADIENGESTNSIPLVI